MERAAALKVICQEYHGSRIARRLTEAQFDEVVAFVDDHDHLGHLEFEYAANRWFLDRDKPKNFLMMQELVMCANTRAKGIRRA